jgi:hypothetical protein
VLAVCVSTLAVVSVDMTIDYNTNAILSRDANDSEAMVNDTSAVVDIFDGLKDAIDQAKDVVRKAMTDLNSLTSNASGPSSDMVNREEEHAAAWVRASLGNEFLSKLVKRSVVLAFTEQKVNGTTLLHMLMQHMADYVDARHRLRYHQGTPPPQSPVHYDDADDLSEG